MYLSKGEEEKVMDLIDKFGKENQKVNPLFYILTGSHLYGFSSDESDIDIRGFHLTPSKEHLKVKSPKEQIKINQDGITDGYEDYENIDFVSYELKKFGYMLNKMNYNVLEIIFNDIQFLNNCVYEMRKLRKNIEKLLPADSARHYYGMAKSNYEKYLSKDRKSYKPIPKKYLYVLRGLLGARYVTQEDSIEPNIRTMANRVKEVEHHRLPHSSVFVDRLIDMKKDPKLEKVPKCLRDDIKTKIESLFKQTSFNTERDEKMINEVINLWMLGIRRKYDKKYLF